MSTNSSAAICSVHSCSPSSCSDSFSSLTRFCNVYIVLGPIFESMALGLNGQILVPLNLNINVFLVSARSSALSTHPTNAILFGYV